jgi:hypothetical protein
LLNNPAASIPNAHFWKNIFEGDVRVFLVYELYDMLSDIIKLWQGKSRTVCGVRETYTFDTLKQLSVIFYHKDNLLKINSTNYATKSTYAGSHFVDRLIEIARQPGYIN